MITPIHWLTLSAILFGIGVYGVLSRRSALGVLIAVELMLNAVALNFAIFNKSLMTQVPEGNLMVIFIIAVAAAEAVVAMAIFVSIYRTRKSIDVTLYESMKG